MNIDLILEGPEFKLLKVVFIHYLKSCLTKVGNVEFEKYYSATFDQFIAFDSISFRYRRFVNLCLMLILSETYTSKADIKIEIMKFKFNCNLSLIQKYVGILECVSLSDINLFIENFSEARWISFDGNNIFAKIAALEKKVKRTKEFSCDKEIYELYNLLSMPSYQIHSNPLSGKASHIYTRLAELLISKLEVEISHEDDIANTREFIFTDASGVERVVSRGDTSVFNSQKSSRNLRIYQDSGAIAKYETKQSRI